MRAIVVAEPGGPEVLTVAGKTMESPGAGEVRVRLHAAGVNPVDTYIRSGGYPFHRPELPYTPGFDGAGVVESVGEPGGLSVGDRVFVAALGRSSTGTYAQQVTCELAAVHPLPGQLSFRQGATLGVPWTTAYRALFQRGGLRAGETVLVHGASGGVGVPTVQLATSAGATVIGTAGSEQGRDLVAALGAEHVLDHRRPGYLDAIGELTNGEGVDLVVEMLADQNLESDVPLLARRGRIVVVGNRGSTTFTPRLLMEREADVRGTAIWNMTWQERAEATREIARRAANLAPPTPSNVFPLAEARQAHEHLASQPAQGQCVLDCG